MTEQASQSTAADESTVTYELTGRVAIITLNRPRYRNAQNSRMIYDLDAAFDRAAQDDDVAVVVLAGAGEHFSSGHDRGTPGRDVDTSYPRMSLWWDSVGKQGVENRLAREEEIYLGMCRRWRDLPKPTIAMVQGACISGGLMVAWICDLIIASDDAYFVDVVVELGMPGVEYFAHVWELGPRQAKEALFLAKPVTAQRAYELGMVNRVVPRADLRERTLELAAEIANKDRLALALIKRSVNTVQDACGQQSALDAAFMIHQLAHAHWAETTGQIVKPPPST